MYHQKVYEDFVPYMYELLSGNMQFMDHWHIEIEFCYCLTGFADYRLSGVIYHLEPGDLLIINSCEAHEVIGTDSSYQGIVMKLGHEFLGKEFDVLAVGAASERLLHLRDPVPEEYRKIQEYLVVLAQNYACREDCRWLIHSALFGFMHEITQKLSFRQTVVPSELENKRKQVYSILDSISFIHQHFAEKITLADIADIQKYHVSSFCRLFHNIMGVTPYNYLIQYRIKHAQNLLEMTDIPISQVGEQCGIPTPKTFSRIFRQHTGKTPIQYRQEKHKQT